MVMSLLVLVVLILILVFCVIMLKLSYVYNDKFLFGCFFFGFNCGFDKINLGI